MKRKKKREHRGYFAYARKDTGSGWVVKYEDRTREKVKWRDHRIPRSENVRTQCQADDYAEAFYRGFCGKNAQLVTASANGVVRAAVPTLRTLADAWMKARENSPKLAPSTTKADRIHLKRHILPVLGDVPLTDADFNTAKVREFVRNMATTKRPKGDREIAPRTVRNILNTLRTMIEDCIDDHWIKDMRANWVRQRSVRRELPEQVGLGGRNVILTYSREQIETLLTCEAVPEYRRLRYLVAVTSGLRDGEMGGLMFADLDLGDRPTMQIERARRLVRKSGETTGKTKTADGVRMLPIHSAAARELKRWKASGWAKLVGRSPAPNDPVFPNRKGAFTRTRASDHVQRDLVTARCATASGGQRRNFHTFRKTFMTLLAMAGTPEGISQRLMGHRPKTVTDAFYTAKTDEMLRDAVEKIRLDLTSAKVIQLHLRAVNDGDNRG